MNYKANVSVDGEVIGTFETPKLEEARAFLKKEYVKHRGQRVGAWIEDGEGQYMNPGKEESQPAAISYAGSFKQQRNEAINKVKEALFYSQNESRNTILKGNLQATALIHEYDIKSEELN